MEVVDEKHIIYLDSSFHPTTEAEYGFTSFVVEYREPLKTIPTIDKFLEEIYGNEKINHNFESIVQIRGHRDAGFQICAINVDEETKELATSITYEASLTGDTEERRKGISRSNSNMVSTDTIILIISEGRTDELFNGISKSK